MSTRVCGSIAYPITLKPEPSSDASDTTTKKADKTIYTFVGTPANPQFLTYADKYAWIKGRAACNDTNVCLNTGS